MITKLIFRNNPNVFLLQHPDNKDAKTVIQHAFTLFQKSPEGRRYFSGVACPRMMCYQDALLHIPEKFFQQAGGVLIYGEADELDLSNEPMITNLSKISLRKIPDAWELYRQGYRLSDMKSICNLYNIHGRGYNIQRPIQECRPEKDWDDEGGIINQLTNTLLYLEKTENSPVPKFLMEDIRKLLNLMHADGMIHLKQHRDMLENQQYLHALAQQYFSFRDDYFQRFGTTNEEWLRNAFEMTDYRPYAKFMRHTAKQEPEL